MAECQRLAANEPVVQGQRVVADRATEVLPLRDENPRRGLSVGAGLVLAFNAETGQPVALLLDNGFLTDLRTGAAGGVAAKHLANPELTEPDSVLWHLDATPSTITRNTTTLGALGRNRTCDTRFRKMATTHVGVAAYNRLSLCFRRPRLSGRWTQDGDSEEADETGAQ
jgi:hypothetical protein